MHPRVRAMLPIPVFLLLSSLARLKTLLSGLSPRLLVLFGMNENSQASTTHFTKGATQPVISSDKQKAPCPPDSHTAVGGDVDDDQDFLCARGCGQSVLPGKEVRDGRAITVWRDWPLGGHDASFDRQRDTLAAAFAVQLERHVAWIESAPLRVAARDRDNAPLSLYHYRYALTSAPAIVYTSTVWWTPVLVDEDAFCDEADDDDDDDDETHTDETGENGGGTVPKERRQHQQQHGGGIDAGPAALAPERPLEVQDVFSDLCIKGVGRGASNDNIDGMATNNITDDDDDDDDNENGNVSGKLISNGLVQGGKRDDRTTALHHEKGQWQKVGAVDLKTATTRLCRRGTIVADVAKLAWRGHVDDVIDQLDAIDQVAARVHAILCFRPVDVCVGISLPTPH